MHHDDHVGAFGEGLAIAGLLVAAVAVVAVVHEHAQAEAARDLDGSIGTVVIHQDADVNQLGELADGDGVKMGAGGHGWFSIRAGEDG